MYLHDCHIENVGPIEALDLRPQFTTGGLPKPLVLVGQNGSGKTVLVSHIADAMVEVAKEHFNNAVPNQVGAAGPYFKVNGLVTRRVGAPHGLALLRFTGENGNIIYLDRSGSVTTSNDDLLSRFPGSQWVGEENQKSVHGLTSERAAQIFKDVLCYFPVSRAEAPHWFNSESQRAPRFRLERRFEGSLTKPIIVETCLDETKDWLMDVVLDDVLAQLSQVQGTSLYPAFSPGAKAKAVVDMVLQKVMQRADVRLTVAPRGTGERLSVSAGESIILPGLEHLSFGQIQLLAIFATILRYADAPSVRSAKLTGIRGVVVVDEIDAHLHADLLYDVLPTLMLSFPAVQFIVTTHSPVFLLGMEKAFGSDGFSVVELPTGSLITTERFSEFGKSFDYYRTTKRFEDEMRTALSAASKPLVYVEGSTDADYLRHAVRELRGSWMTDALEIRSVGQETKGGSTGSGSSGLARIAKVAKAAPDLLKTDVVLLYDWDEERSDEESGRLRVRSMPKAAANDRKGVENLLSDVLYAQIANAENGDRFFGGNTTSDTHGGYVTKRALKKRALCDYVVTERPSSELAGFEPVVALLERTLGLSAPVS